MKNPLDFLKETRVELRKVSWPTKQETIRLTVVVLVVSLVVGLYLGLADFILAKLVSLLF